MKRLEREEEERIRAAQLEQERLEREEQERQAKLERERIDREKAEAAKTASRGSGVRGVRGTRASMRGTRTASRAGTRTCQSRLWYSNEHPYVSINNSDTKRHLTIVQRIWWHPREADGDYHQGDILYPSKWHRTQDVNHMYVSSKLHRVVWCGVVQLLAHYSNHHIHYRSL